MKNAQLLLLVLCLAFVISCSTKSDPQPVSSLSTVSLSLANTSPTVAVYTILSTSSNPYAQGNYAYIKSVFTISDYTKVFTPPTGAAKSLTQIVGVNESGKDSTQQDYLVYMWTDPNLNRVAYQVSETSDSYTFEFFYKGTGTDWIRSFYAEEKKDQSAGFLNQYDLAMIIKGFNEYKWTSAINTLNFVSTDYLGNASTLSVNTQTNAGDLEFLSGSILSEKMTWDAQGHGTYAFYDTDGVTITNNGTW